MIHTLLKLPCSYLALVGLSLGLAHASTHKTGEVGASQHTTQQASPKSKSKRQQHTDKPFTSSKLCKKPSSRKKNYTKPLTILGLSLLIGFFALRYSSLQEFIIFQGNNNIIQKLLIKNNAYRVRKDTMKFFTPKGEEQLSYAAFTNEKCQQTVLFFGGNCSSTSTSQDFLEGFHEMFNMNIYMLNPPGYDWSEGCIQNEKQFLKSSEYFYKEVMKTNKDKEIFFMGHSLGGSLAAYQASRHPCSGVILISTFTSIPAMADDITKIPYLAYPLLRYKLDTLSRIKNINAPILILHSREDTVIDYHHGEDLAREAKRIGRKHTFKTFQGGHNDLGSHFYKIHDFINDNLQPTSVPLPHSEINS